MASFQHFHSQPGQNAQKPKFSNDGLSLSVILQFAETAKKQNFEALCRVQPLVKTYRDKVEEVSREMSKAESSLAEETEVPPTYAAAYAVVNESFAVHIGALDEWTSGLINKDESQSEQAMIKVKQSGGQLEAALSNLSV